MKEKFLKKSAFGKTQVYYKNYPKRVRKEVKVGAIQGRFYISEGTNQRLRHIQ